MLQRLPAKLFSRACIIMAFVCLAFSATAQVTETQKLVSNIETARARLPAEKLYLHFDKPYYTAGDTVWFKAYLFAPNYSASAISGKLYVELVNDSSRIVNSFAIPIYAGLGQGDMVLDEKITDGRYTIRAYTNWMQNFGEDAYFHKQFYVGNPLAATAWLVNEQHSIKPSAEGNEVSLNLQLTDLAKKAIPYREVELKLTEGKKTLFRRVHTSKDNGQFLSDFIIPAKTNTRDLTLTITDKLSKNKFSFPFYPGGQLHNVDLQFMPEGGNLVAGLYSKVAFKAIGEDGLSVDLSGKIINGTGEDVAEFSSTYKGMGSFAMMPVAGQTYSAKFKVNGVDKTVALPVVKPSGIAFRVDNISNTDSVYLYIKATADIAAADKNYSLIAQSAAGLYFGAPVNLKNGYSNFRLAKSRFATGIVSFSIAEGNQPLNERRIFIDHQDRLKLGIVNSQDQYQPNDSVALAFNITDADGKPVQGSFSVAVTDNTLIRNKEDAGNLTSHMLLTSEIKGHIENPAWYFKTQSADRSKALDNLLLTQGWTAFDWSNVGQPPSTPKFAAEPDNRLSGLLTNFFKKPVRGATVNIFASSKKNGIVLMDTVSNERGEFLFPDLPVVDTIAYVIKLKNKKGKEMAAGITLNEFTAAPINPVNDIRPAPWFLTADSLMTGYFKKPKKNILPGLDKRDIRGRLLNEVVIRAKQKPMVMIARQWGYIEKEITEKELIAAKKTSLYDIMHDKFANMRESWMWKPTIFARMGTHAFTDFVLSSDLVADFYIDGQSARNTLGLDFQRDSLATYRGYINGFLNNLGGDDVTSVKIVRAYSTFVVITTRGGRGISTSAPLGTIAYRPIPYNLPRAFYRPKYTAKSTPEEDRATLHWEPNLITDAEGKANLSFYAADKPATYTVTIEGSNMNGDFGSQTGTIIVSRQAYNGKAQPNATGK